MKEPNETKEPNLSLGRYFVTFKIAHTVNVHIFIYINESSMFIHDYTECNDIFGQWPNETLELNCERANFLDLAPKKIKLTTL